MNALITGADGFIGSHLTELLVKSGYTVKALSQYNSFNNWGWLEDTGCLDQIEVLNGDVRDPHYCKHITKDVDIIFHLAALIAIPYSYIAPDSYVDTNIKGTLNICQAALENGCRKIIHTSTSEVYGTAQYVPIDENHPLQPQSPYSATKIAAHTDDEALGCGGTIARHVAAGDAVHAVFMADGFSSRASAHNRDHEQRMEAARQAHEILGLGGVHYMGLPDNRMDGMALLDVVQPLEKIIHECAPDVIYTHHRGDLNIDHRITHQAVLTACRSQPGHCVKEIYGFEVLSSTDWAFARQDAFVPNVFMDISAFLLIKLKALHAYQSEMRPPPHTRSIEHAELLARHRGYTVGVEAAEAFEVVRIVR